MENKVLFRKAFQGFNKEDVVSYIDKISKDTNRIIAEKDACINELNQNATQAQSRIQELEQRCVQMENHENEIALQSQEQINFLKDRIQQLEAELEQKSDCHNDADSELVCELKHKLEESENARNDLAKQLESYKEIDGVQRDIGNIIMKSEKRASEIVARAKSEAETMMSQATRDFEQTVQRRIKACCDIADTFDKGKQDIDLAHRTLCEKLDSIKSAVDAFYNTLEMSRKIVHENVDSIKNTASNTQNELAQDNK